MFLLLLLPTGHSPRESVTPIVSSIKLVNSGTRGIVHIFFQIIPRVNEKELFPVIVHEDQSVVPARRIHHLLQVPFPFADWMASLVLRNVVEPGVDYFERPGSDVVFSIYAIQKITATDSFSDDDEGYATRAKTVFKYCSSLQHHLVHLAMKSMSS